MRFITISLLAILGMGPVVLTTGCGTTSVERAHTLQSVGVSAKAAIDLAADLYVAKKISEEQWEKIADFYDLKFQPAFRAAVVAVRLDVGAPAQAELLALLAQLVTLVTPTENGPVTR